MWRSRFSTPRKLCLFALLMQQRCQPRGDVQGNWIIKTGFNDAAGKELLRIREHSRPSQIEGYIQECLHIVVQFCAERGKIRFITRQEESLSHHAVIQRIKG